MRTKLLKKVRKRYEILDHPKGAEHSHYSNPKPHFELRDRDTTFRNWDYNYEDGEFGTKEVVLEKVMKHLTRLIRNDYWKQVKGKKTIQNKIWY